MPKPTKNWNNITNGDGYKLSMAEFKGATIQALQDIDKRLSNLESYNRDTRLLSLTISGISGLVSGIFGVNLKK